MMLSSRVPYLIDRASIDAVDSVATENAVSDEGIDLCRTLFLQQLCCPGYGVGGVSQVINQNGSPLCNIADEHHGCVLAISDLRWSSLYRRVST